MQPTSIENRLSVLLRLSAFGMLLLFGLLLFAAVDFDLGRLAGIIRDTHPLVFVGLMCTLPLVGFPIAVFYLYAGTVFPWWQATALCSLSLAINMTIAFPVARHLLATPLAQILARYRKSLPALTEENQFRVTFLVRSVPGVPFFMQNYLLPLLGVRFAPYLLISWSIQSDFAAGMAAVPHLVERTGWVPAGIILFLLVLLGLFHRLYLGKSLTNGSPVE
jgi:uncharacterized membrane protein YdjX (TVP38/TMEM64 family)